MKKCKNAKDQGDEGGMSGPCFSLLTPYVFELCCRPHQDCFHTCSNGFLWLFKYWDGCVYVVCFFCPGASKSSTNSGSGLKRLSVASSKLSFNSSSIICICHFVTDYHLPFGNGYLFQLTVLLKTKHLMSSCTFLS